jgi:hypothetical protein
MTANLSAPAATLEMNKNCQKIFLGVSLGGETADFAKQIKLERTAYIVYKFKNRFL